MRRYHPCNGDLYNRIMRNAACRTLANSVEAYTIKADEIAVIYQVADSESGGIQDVEYAVEQREAVTSVMCPAPSGPTL
jgi:hypothetical protein